jgi:hypothetical protein
MSGVESRPPVKTSRKKKPLIDAPRRVVNFPVVNGKVLQEVSFSTMAGSHSIALRFRDKTEMHFGLEPGFTMVADYADWKTGDMEIIREWRPLRSRSFRQ